MINKYIEQNKEEIVKQIQSLIQIPSVHAASNNPSMPFGKEANHALEHFLALGKQLGFRTKNIDGYCGYVEFGEGEEMLGIIGHLDVVPEGDDWNYPAFSGVIEDNKIFGRGTIDDKGPVISSLYAMKYVMDNETVNKRVRLIVGLNEERDWECINYYKQHEESPTVGFSPDADFPCIYAEKSIISTFLKSDMDIFQDKKIQITEIDCHQNAINVVPKICSATLKIDEHRVSMDALIKSIIKILNQYDYEIDIYQLSHTELKITSHGVQAHAAHPELGTNAISRLIVVLHEIFKVQEMHIDLFHFFNKYIHTQYDGKNLNLYISDESGALTLNVGYFGIKENQIQIGMNVRIPIHTDIEKVKTAYTTKLKPYPTITFETSGHMPSLYIPKDNPLIQTLCRIYNEETKQDATPIAIGGATYARAFDNCVSFGANFPGHKDMCHQTNEFIDIDCLLLATKIYIKAIIALTS